MGCKAKVVVSGRDVPSAQKNWGRGMLEKRHGVKDAGKEDRARCAGKTCADGNCRGKGNLRSEESIPSFVKGGKRG